MEDTADYTVEVCQGGACARNFSDRSFERAKNEIEFKNIKNIKLGRCNCIDHCEKGPNIRITNNKTGKQEVKNYMRAINIAKEINTLSQKKS